MNMDFTIIDNIAYACYNDEPHNRAVLVSANRFTGSRMIIPESITYNGEQYIVMLIKLDKDALLNKGLRSIVIPKYIDEIDNAFWESFPNLISIEVSKENPIYFSINGLLFHDDALLRIPLGFSGELHIPPGIKKIDEYAFNKCDRVSKTYIPASVEVIFPGFICCESTFEVDEANTFYSSYRGVLYNKERTAIVRVPPQLATGNYVVENGIFTLCATAFSFNIDLNSVKIERGVIGNYCFYGCKYCKCVILGQDVTDIGMNTFMGMANLQSLYVFLPYPEYINLEENIFDSYTTDTCVLHVLKGLKQTYMKLDQWNKFLNIVDDLMPGQTITPPRYIKEKHPSVLELYYLSKKQMPDYGYNTNCNYNTGSNNNSDTSSYIGKIFLWIVIIIGAIFGLIYLMNHQAGSTSNGQSYNSGELMTNQSEPTSITTDSVAIAANEDSLTVSETPEPLDEITDLSKEDGNWCNQGYIDLGLSVYWSTCNLGADSPEIYGKQFVWGDASGELEEGSQSPLPESFDGDISGTRYDVVNTYLEGGWRMPTRNEMHELLTHCTHKMGNYRGTDGYMFIGPNGKSIFLPILSPTYEPGEELKIGEYWTSTASKREATPKHSYILFFVIDGDMKIDDTMRINALPVRPVRSK